jgi:hypothetical protein
MPRTKRPTPNSFGSTFCVAALDARPSNPSSRKPWTRSCIWAGRQTRSICRAGQVPIRNNANPLWDCPAEPAMPTPPRAALIGSCFLRALQHRARFLNWIGCGGFFVIASFFSENQRPLRGSTRKGFGEGGSYRSTPDTTARVPFRALETGGHRHGAVILTVSQIVSKGRKQGTGSPAIQLRLFDPNLFPEGQEPHPSKDVRKTSFYAL